MSSVSILGDTSGSVLLQAPSVAGSTQINIAAQSGTLNVGGPSFSARASTNQSLSGTTETKVSLDTEQWDTNNCFASNRFTPNVAGYYQLSGSIAYTGAVSGYASAYIWKNGARLIQTAEVQLSTASYNAIPISAMVYCNGTTDYIELYTTTQNNAVIYGDASLLYTYFQGFLARTA